MPDIYLRPKDNSLGAHDVEAFGIARKDIIARITPKDFSINAHDVKLSSSINVIAGFIVAGGGVTVSASVLSFAASAQTSAVSGSANVSLADQLVLAGIPTASVSGNASAPTSALSLLTEALSSNATGFANVAATVLSTTATTEAASIRGDAVVSPALLSFSPAMSLLPPSVLANASAAVSVIPMQLITKAAFANGIINVEIIDAIHSSDLYGFYQPEKKRTNKPKAKRRSIKLRTEPLRMKARINRPFVFGPAAAMASKSGTRSKISACRAAGSARHEVRLQRAEMFLEDEEAIILELMEA